MTGGGARNVHGLYVSCTLPAWCCLPLPYSLANAFRPHQSSPNFSACCAVRSEITTPVYILSDWSILAAREDAEELVLGTDVEDEFQQRKAVQVLLCLRWLTILQSTCWVCGANASTLE